jgi:hypothetical protein
MSTPTGNNAAKNWEKVRLEFHTSIMVDTSLNSLAQNLDGAEWPIQGEEETPAKYIDLSYDELRLVPGLNGHPGRIDQLIEILEQTLAFDNPFGDMVAQSAAAEAAENPLLKNLARLGIPPDFPIEESLLSEDVKEFCKLERILTLADFAEFAQNMPPQVVVGGDFRKLLNALSHVNEAALATIVPFRPGSKGLHLPEALSQVFEMLPPAQRLALLKRQGGKLTEVEEKLAAGVTPESVTQAEETVQGRVERVMERFRDEVRALPVTIREHGSLARHLVVLGNPQKEALVAKILGPVLKVQEAPAAPAAPKKPGFWDRLAGWFGR